MIPPLVRRCPDCGHLGIASRFHRVEGEEDLVECPSCGYCFAVPDRPWLAGLGLR